MYNMYLKRIIIFYEINRFSLLKLVEMWIFEIIQYLIVKAKVTFNLTCISTSGSQKFPNKKINEAINILLYFCIYLSIKVYGFVKLKRVVIVMWALKPLC